MANLDVLVGDIFDNLDKKDLIVNSINRYMLSGSGVCGAIFKMAGRSVLEEYCRNSFNEYMKVNEVRITPGFNINIVICFILCPKFWECKEHVEELLEGYNNIFIAAKEKGYGNIVSVSIGTGVHRYKHEDVAKSVYGMLKQLVKEYDINFTLVLPSEEIKVLYC